MKLDLIDPVAEAIMGFELGNMAIGIAGQFGHMRTGDRFSRFGQQRVRPANPLAFGDLDKQPITRERIVTDERRRLVHNLMRGVAVRRQAGNRANMSELISGALSFMACFPKRQCWRAGRTG